MAVRRRCTVSRSSVRHKTGRLPRMSRLIPCLRGWSKVSELEEGYTESKLLKTEDALMRNILCTRKSVATTRLSVDPDSRTDVKPERRMISASESSNGGPKLT